MSTLVRTLSVLVAPDGTGTALLDVGALEPELELLLDPHAARSDDATGSVTPSATARRRNWDRLIRPSATSSINESMPGYRATDLSSRLPLRCTLRTDVARWY